MLIPIPNAEETAPDEAAETTTSPQSPISAGTGKLLNPELHQVVPDTGLRPLP